MPGWGQRICILLRNRSSGSDGVEEMASLLGQHQDAVERLAGCLRGEEDFIIHSHSTEEAAFDAHAELPRMKRFLGLVGS